MRYWTASRSRHELWHRVMGRYRDAKNSGSYAVPGWWWYYGLTSAQVSSYLNANTARLIDLEPYDIGGGNIRYAAVMVSNTGTAARSWWWYYGKTSSEISSLLSGRRLIDLDSYNTTSGKRYSAVMIANTTATAVSQMARNSARLERT